MKPVSRVGHTSLKSGGPGMCGHIEVGKHLTTSAKSGKIAKERSWVHGWAYRLGLWRAMGRLR